MSTTALILVILGLSIMLSRAPLLVAPVGTRNTYLKLFDTDGKMRLLGLVFGAVAGALVWFTWAEAGIAETAIRYVAGFVLALAVLAMVPFPAFARRLATNVWMAFPPNAMRVMGAAAVAFGAFLVWYGLGM